ncbi:hypothetical protein C6P46_000598 [Rhodotorula mucilaginosa]|uniref:Cohesin loading factor n=1 Tax=Rhodotorula mucilaginosa TaxID=5537 RepID=A0A9P7B7T5_RHOMI|nr:hypothetical protein C6P46_000598 [Rhodotorula mucilaginosa]
MDPNRSHALPAGNASSEGSPTKRRRLDPQPWSPSALNAQQHGQKARSDVPVHITLWAIASSLRSSTRNHLLPLLAKRPSSTSPSSQRRYSHLWASYLHQTAAEIAALRAAVRVTSETSETKGTRTELRAQAMLAEALVEIYDGTGDEDKIAGEADGAITRALAIASSHPSLSAFTAPLTLLQLRLALAVHKPVKFIRTSLKRLLASVSAPQGSTNLSNTNNLSATIQALAFSARLEPTGAGAGGGGSSSDSLAAWRSVRELAAAGDGGGTMMQQPHVWVVAALAETRSVLMTGGLAELSTAIQLLDALHPYLGVDDSPPRPPAPSPTTTTTTATAAAPARAFNYPKALKVLYRFLYCLVKMQTGHVKEAKAMLKSAHRLLDLEEEEDPVEGRAEPDRVRVPILSPTDPNQVVAELAIQVPPHHVLYSFAFLVSSNPRAILFPEEGIRTAQGQLNGREALPLVRSVAAISTHLRAAVPYIVRLHLNLASLLTMRSAYREAENHLLDAVTLLRAFDSGWQQDPATNWILLGWAQVRIARAAREGRDEAEAQQALEALLWRTRPGGVGGAEQLSTVAVESSTTMTRRIGALAMLLLRLSTDEKPMSTFTASQDPVIRSLLDTIRLNDNHNDGSSGTHEKSPSAANRNNNNDNGNLSAHSKLVSALASALTESTITASKMALSDALTLANDIQANYVRVGILALLSNVFLFTRDREAQMMLASALKLAQQLGAADQRACVVTAPESDSDKAAAPILVGNARLALWSGERLLEMYRSEGKEDKVREQARLNLASRMLLEQDERAAQASL